MEQWQIDALQALLETETKEVEEGLRVYSSSADYGNSRYHLIDKLYNGVLIEQVETDEKYGKRIKFASDEVPVVLKTLLIWYLEDVHQRQQSASTIDDTDALGDLDDHPF